MRDVWPSQEEIRGAIARSLTPAMFQEQYANVFSGNQAWNEVGVPQGQLYEWEPSSGYIREPPFFEGLARSPAPVSDILGARVLAYLGDSVTTDHISPAGSIDPNSPAGLYLLARGVSQREFNAYGARRGNHEVMMRGTFANIRIRNRLLPGVEGGYTVFQPTGERLSIYDAAMRYAAIGTPLLILAGREYGTGSSRDWAAKGPSLLGVRAVLAESFERIHRSNLIGMGVLPLEFLPGESAQALGLTGFETFDVRGLAGRELHPKQRLMVSVSGTDTGEKTFEVVARIDTPVEVEYYRNGGILQTVLRNMTQDS